LSEEKIAGLRDTFLDLVKQSLKEHDEIASINRKPADRQLAGCMAIFLNLEDIVGTMCECGISGAKLRRVSSEEIERLAKELHEGLMQLRNRIANNDYGNAIFLTTQYMLLHRRIVKSVTNMLSPAPLYEFSRTEMKSILGKNVFIVHGRDDKPKLELARMLEKLSFSVIILSEQPDKGRTIIEKLEQETIDIGYAFVILTPDDIGFQELIQELSKQYPLVSEFVKNRPIVQSLLKPRARQNVILELGYFVGKIGRNRVCCLYKGEIELPSDIHGVLFKKFDKSVEECYKGILEELRAIGYQIEA
jgi:predicted nucleotide-binding protein